jgi:hypothetical protein
MRLSWPRANDTRRATYGHLPPRRKNSGGFTELYIIQTSFYDMEMHNYLADLSTGSEFSFESKLLVNTESKNRDTGTPKGFA